MPTKPTRFRFLPGLAAAAFVAVLLAAAVADAGQAATLASHRALYVLKGDSKGTVAIEGEMAFETVDVCDGWTVKQQTVLRVSGSGGETSSVISSTSWESKDGRHFRFERTTRRDGVLVEKIGGRAEMGEEGGRVILNDGDGTEIPLPPGTLFPSRHTALVVDLAKRGERFLMRVIFDGSAGDVPNKVSAVIGNPRELPGLADPSTQVIAWPVRLAFFPVDKDSATPEVEIAVLMQEDGVARDIELDYPDMTVHGTLAKYIPLSPGPC